MTKTKFEYFHNHGDEDGNNSLTICFGDSSEPDHIIVSCEDTEEDAIEAVKRLNEILDTSIKDKLLQFKKWYDKLSPRDKCTVWPPAGSGSGTGLYNMSDEDLIEKFLNKKL